MRYNRYCLCACAVFCVPVIKLKIEVAVSFLILSDSEVAAYTALAYSYWASFHNT